MGSPKKVIFLKRTWIWSNVYDLSMMGHEWHKKGTQGKKRERLEPRFMSLNYMPNLYPIKGLLMQNLTLV